MFILIFLLVLSILVLIHELGHFLVAKKFGIKVEEFGYGFPPKVFGKKIGETLYSFNLLPIGGFVKLFGEDEAGGGKVKLSASSSQGSVSKNSHQNYDVKRAFFARPAWQRASVIVAGVVMNLLLAFLIYYIFLFISGFKTLLPLYPSVKYPNFYFVNQVVRPQGLIIEEISKGSPADQKGIQAPVKVVSINGEFIDKNGEFGDIITQNKGKEINLNIQDFKTDKISSISVALRENPPAGQGALGVGYNYYEVPLVFLSYDTPVQKIFSGITHSINLTKYNFQIFGRLFSQSVAEKSAEPLGEGVSGPLGILAVFKEIFKLPSKEALLQTLNIAGMISISLAIFNILPIPALDGGRFFFVVMEMVTRKKISPKIEGIIHTVGMIVLLGLIVLVSVRDIFRFF